MGSDNIIGRMPETFALIKLPGTFQHVLSLRLWSLNKTSFLEPCQFRPHKHEYYEIIIPLRGLYRCLLNGEAIAPVAPGLFLFIQPGDQHEDLYDAGLEFLAILFSLRDLTAGRWPGLVIDEAVPIASRTFDLRSGSRAERLMRMIAEGDPAAAAEPANVLSLEALSEAFFWSLFLDFPKKLLSRAFSKCLGEDEFRIKAIAFFDTMLREGFDLERMAAELSVSRRALGYKFKEIFGTSPAKAFMSWRVGKAASLLENGASVKAAASFAGFADQFHFSKAFSREMGFPPSQFGRKDRL
jgi:AraC-like DNA-binding protein